MTRGLHFLVSNASQGSEQTVIDYFIGEGSPRTRELLPSQDIAVREAIGLKGVLESKWF